MQPNQDEINNLLILREKLRKNGDYIGADKIRNTLLSKGYVVNDSKNGVSNLKNPIKIEKIKSQVEKRIVVFGSGELSSVGRGIHESLIKDIPSPVKIALLETPAGYEDNPHHWYEKLKLSMEKGLVNHKPDIKLIPALRKETHGGTDDPTILEPLLWADYIHTGAGSPTYAVRHLKDSLALKMIQERTEKGVPVSIASAVAVAFGKFTLPVYEIYFAGNDPSWIEGINFFANWGLNLTFLPHWNNTDGGRNIDTRFTYMGEKRFKKLLSLLPGPTTIVGIDEHTAIYFDFIQKNAKVLGKGTVTIIRGTETQIYATGTIISFTSFL